MTFFVMDSMAFGLLLIECRAPREENRLGVDA
jgi:hypothetical protein